MAYEISEKEKKKFFKLVKKIRKSTPEKYNQILLGEYLVDPEIDWLISISNRTDGKSFNYINLLVEIAIQLDVGFMLLSRSFMVRNMYIDFIHELFEATGRNLDQLYFKRNNEYTLIVYQDKVIGFVSDLNNATDLKLASNFMKKFPIICYDEFLALDGDYLPDEWDKLKTIYESVDRNEGIPYIGSPKIILLGNAVNFSSPLLAPLDLYSKLENHPLNTHTTYGNISLEMNKNESANERRNLRAFNSKDDAMTLGQFKVNNFKISSENEKELIRKNGDSFFIKLRDNQYLQVLYDEQYNVLLSYHHAMNLDYEFCELMSDLKEDVIFLSENFYSPTYYKKYDKGLFLFDNVFTKEFITKNSFYIQLKIMKCIGIYESKKPDLTQVDKNEINYERQYLERTKKALLFKMG